MQNLDPTYLRYIYDNLIKGSVNPDNASELPDGLIGLYEEAFEEHLPVLQRQKLLQRFAIFALLKKEVSAVFVAEVLGESETEILEFINTNASWFNSPEPGKFQLYHERLKVFIIQKISQHELYVINEKIIKLLIEKGFDSSEYKDLLAKTLLHQFLIKSTFTKLEDSETNIIFTYDWTKIFFEGFLSQSDCINELTILNSIAISLKDHRFSFYAALLTLRSREYYWSKLLELNHQKQFNDNIRQQLKDATHLFDDKITKFTILLYSYLLAERSLDTNYIKQSLNDLYDLINNDFNKEIPIKIVFDLTNKSIEFGLDWHNLVKKFIDFNECFCRFIINQPQLIDDSKAQISLIITNEFKGLNVNEANGNLFLLIKLYKDCNNKFIRELIIKTCNDVLKKRAPQSVFITKIIVLDQFYEIGICDKLNIKESLIYKRFISINNILINELRELVKRSSSNNILLLLLIRAFSLKDKNSLVLILGKIRDLEYLEFIGSTLESQFNDYFNDLIKVWVKKEKSLFEKEVIKARHCLKLLRNPDTEKRGLKILKDVIKILSSYKDNLIAEKPRKIADIQYLLIKEGIYNLNDDTRWFFEQEDILNSSKRENLNLAFSYKNLNIDFFSSVYKSENENLMYISLLSLPNDCFIKINYLNNTLRNLKIKTPIPSIQLINEYLFKVKPEKLVKPKFFVRSFDFNHGIGFSYDVSKSLKIIDSIKNKRIKNKLIDLLIVDGKFQGYLKTEALHSLYSIYQTLGKKEENFISLVKYLIREILPNHVIKEQLGYICEFELDKGNTFSAVQYWRLQKKLLSSEHHDVALSADKILYTALRLNDIRFLKKIIKKVEKEEVLLDYFYAELALAYFRIGNNKLFQFYYQKALDNKTFMLGMDALPKAFLLTSKIDDFLRYLSSSLEFGNPEEVFILSLNHYEINNELKLLEYIKKVKRFQKKSSSKEYLYMFLLGKEWSYSISDDFLKKLNRIDKNYLQYFISSYSFNPHCMNKMLYVIFINSLLIKNDFNYLNNYLYFSLFEDGHTNKYRTSAIEILDK